MAAYNLMIDSPNVRYTDEFIESDYVYESVKCVKNDDTKTITVSDGILVDSKLTVGSDRQVPSRLR